MVKAVYAVDWTEYERGWGNRPDGLTLHKDLETANKYIKDYWGRQPDEVPDEYSAPGTPRLLEVDDDVHDLVERKGSLWANPRGNTVDKNYIKWD